MDKRVASIGLVLTGFGVALGMGLLAGIWADSPVIGLLAGLGIATVGLLVVSAVGVPGVLVASSRTTRPTRASFVRGAIFGVALGVVFAIAFGNMAFLGAGLPVGFAVGVGIEQRNTKDH